MVAISELFSQAGSLIRPSMVILVVMALAKESFLTIGNSAKVNIIIKSG
jgi:hypothetical protein